MTITWEEKYATGDEKIDEQHRQLFRFSNKLDEFLQQESVETAEVDQLLRFLQTYINSHFRYEEACMLKRQCPVAKENRDAHQTFLEFFQKSSARYRKEGFSKEWLEELNGYLQEWLTSHICDVDSQLRHCSH